MDEQLIQEVKNYLEITWEMTDGEENRLWGMISRGMCSLQAKIGECDFYTDTQEKALLLNYVMYDRAGALADFWQHYKGELLSLRLNRKVETYAEKQNVSEV